MQLQKGPWEMVFEVAWILEVKMGWQPLELIHGVAEKKSQPLFLEVFEVHHQGECQLTCPLSFSLALYLNLRFLLFLDEWYLVE